MKFWLGIFGLGAGLNILLGLHGWPAALHGNLDDPDSYMRLERILQGVKAGHLTNIVARDDSGAGVVVEWSRLMDVFLWAGALPLAPFVGWRHALLGAGMISGPIIAGLLAVSLTYVAELFAARRFLWLMPACLALPALQNYAGAGVVTHHVLLLVLIAFTAGLAIRAADGDVGRYFITGLCGGFAVWLTPETLPFIMLSFGALFCVWLERPLGAGMAALGAGFFDVLCFGLAIDPPVGGYGVAEIDRLSIVFVTLGLALLLGGVLVWRLQALPNPALRRCAGLAGVALLLACWLSLFPNILRGPYGLMSPADAKLFFANITEMQPARPDAQSFALIWPGLAGLFILLPLCLAQRGWRCWYGFACLLLACVLGVKFLRFAPFSAGAAAVILVIGLQNISARFSARPGLAAAARIGIIALVLLVPFLPPFAAARAAKPAPPGPACDLSRFAPALDVAAGKVVLADVNLTPELLWRTKVLTVGSPYHHGVAGFLAARAAWRASPGSTEPAAVAATKAQFILFCLDDGRTDLVADLPGPTLWDALMAGKIPPWLSLAATKDGWRLYRIQHG